MSSLQPSSVPLKYTIASSSPHSGKYAPGNIMEDKPADQASRWSGALQGNTTQWITLELETLSILKTITFGKFSKPHPCNAKEVKVFVGTSQEHMSEILHSSLRNDSIPETFILNHINTAGICFPTRFVKIMPLMAHGQNFHISVWHVGLTGISDQDYVQGIQRAYEDYRETAVMRYILKHLRHRRLLSPFQTTLTRSGVHLEHPLVSQLYDDVVLQGDWMRSEQLFQQMSSAGLFHPYLQSQQPCAEWTRLSATDADGDVPQARGGHAMCIDPINEVIYVLGGWDGEKSLDDFWAYSIREDKWKVLSHSTTKEQNAPGARSCHKMVFDTKTGSIYVLGRLSDSDALREPSTMSSRTRSTAGASGAGLVNQRRQQERPTSPLATSSTHSEKTYCSEFYRYHTRGVLAGKWDFLSIDTHASGGPPLVYDLQMAMDSEAQMIYVFGGRVVDGDWDTSTFAGLYSYNVSTSKWTILQDALASSTGIDLSSGSVRIPPRYGHSMVFDHITKVLYIFAGQQEDKYLSDMYSYDIKTGIASEVFSNFSMAGGPEACFTQRAIIDPTLKEIYVFSGLTKGTVTITNPSRPKSHAYSKAAILKDRLHNWVYKYDTRPGKWTQIMKVPDQPANHRPMPRFAHQVVYNPQTRAIFLHGGNAGSMLTDTGGETEEEEANDGVSIVKGRLDDFWKMELTRPGPDEIIRQCKFAIRQQQFREMCEDSSPVKSLTFLQKEVATVVDHENKEEEEQFRALLTHLLSPSSQLHPFKPSTPSSSSESVPASLHQDDSCEGSTRPRKRSRSGHNREQKSSTSSGEEGRMWMNDLAVLSGTDTTSLSSTRRLQEMVDPREARIRGEHAQKEGPVSGTRYNQRMQVFESLMKFVKEGEKQPDDDLLDLVENDKAIKGP